jgi:hypothetical protein
MHTRLLFFIGYNLAHTTHTLHTHITCIHACASIYTRRKDREARLAISLDHRPIDRTRLLLLPERQELPTLPLSQK